MILVLEIKVFRSKLMQRLLELTNALL